MKIWLNKYFGFTKREYNGLMVLMGLVLVISLSPYLYRFYFRETGPITAEERTAIAKLILVSEESPAFKFREEAAPEEAISSAILFPFDPNTIDLTRWQKLGLSTKQAQAILNYRKKGGKFYKPEDLQKMYSISAEKYEQLAPYIRIEASTLKHAFPFSRREALAKKEPVMIELNSADTLALDQLKGIGAAFARRIVNYRTRLGGFYKKEQLMEVFGLDSAKYEEIKDHISLDLSRLQKININSASFETLKNHPYLNYKQINALLQYRKQHGNYTGLDDLKKVAILSPQNIENLAPYFIF